jgi:predicted acetyltransferase
MTVVDYVSINKAANGYIVFYKESNNVTSVEAEFVALDIEEALDIVREIFKYDETTVNMSHIVDEKIRKDS